ncbi:MAG: hypothetical protein P8J87_18695, partial [Verrucomicrobiales bacterium]|nr:hypothetical protein [Verrucomicrobiales bacterium]
LLLLAAGVALDSPDPAPLPSSFDDLLIEAFIAAENPAPASTLFIAAESAETLFTLASAYHHAAPGCSLFSYPRTPEKPILVDGQPTVPPVAVPPSEAAAFLSTPTTKIAAIAIGLDSPAATLRFATEPGVHLFVAANGNRHRAMVGMLDTAPADVALFLENIVTPAYGHAPSRRTFDSTKPAYRDHVLSKRGRAKFSPSLLSELVDAALVARANTAIT